MAIKLKMQLDNFDQESERTGLKCLDKSLAQQQFAEESDINTIVERFHLTGEVPQLEALPSFQDFGDIFDFQTAMTTIRQANETFMSLPAQLRARFHNDPHEFLQFTGNKDNLDEAGKLGLLSEATLERLQKARDDAKAKEAADAVETYKRSLEAPDEPQRATKGPKK